MKRRTSPRRRRRKKLHVIDVHNHIGVSLRGAAGKKDELLSWMNQYGIAQAVIFAIDEEDRGDTYSHLNDAILAIMKENPKRFIAFCRVQPKAGDLAVQEMRRAKSLGFSGLKLHPRSDDFKPEHCDAVLKAAAELHWPTMLHTDHPPYQSVEDWEPTFRRHSKVNFILGHGGKDHWQDAAHLAITLPNVYIETSTLSYNRTRSLLEMVGPKKIVFGSDYPYSHPYLEKKKYEFLVKDRADLERIMTGNARRLIRC